MIDRRSLLDEYFRLTREALPAKASAAGWIVRHDHCFQRIVLDHVCGDAWRTVLRGPAPACRQLDDDQLARAVRLAAAIEIEGDALLRRLDRQSLAWRRLRRADTAARAPDAA